MRPDDKKIIFPFFFKYLTVVQNERTELNTADKQHTSISPRCIGRNKNTGILILYVRRESVHKPKEVKCVKVVEVEEGGGNALWDVLLSTHARDGCSTLCVKEIR